MKTNTGNTAFRLRQFSTRIEVLDATTGIELGKFYEVNKCRVKHRAQHNAIASVQHRIIEDYAKPIWTAKYGITAKQFDALLRDERIKPLESYTFKATTEELTR